MAVKAKGQITLSTVVDVKATYRYYLLQTSTLSTPSKPTTYPPASTWSDSEPSYTEGSSDSLYFVDCTVFCDDTFVYSTVSLSTAYEAAKIAYNKALAAAKTATNYIKSTTQGLIIGNVSASTLGNNILIDTDSVDIRHGDTVLARYSAEQIELGINSDNARISLCNGSALLYNELDPDFDFIRFNIHSNHSINIGTVNGTYINSYYDNSTNYGSAGIHVETFLPGYSEVASKVYLYSNYRSGSSIDQSCEITMDKGEILLSADEEIRLNSLVYTDNNIVLPNDCEICGINTSGNSMELVGLSAGNNTVIGFGGYNQSVGQTRIYGKTIRMFVGTADVNYKPYFEAGDSVSGIWWGCGFISSSSQKIYFTIPLAKPVIGSPTVTVTTVDGYGFQVRQDGSYAYGSSSSVYATPSAYAATLAWDGGSIRITATMPNTTNAVNNAPCGIACNIKITFS